ncbi:Polygalacturonase inhibitor [Dichanthelium oligosanthes]|uniref:Polygalacturonase inhibitor n=1 Tax=Dichanthelium oligosanthes TaxID=888268 RepID=A0A1E5VH91_9POAL|nr:Polygalacturonase inhibitor [Dichanthelium oligosanthes]
MTTMTRGAFLYVVLLLAVTSSLTTAASKARCHPGDKAALVAINAELGNYFASWIPYPYCEWYEIDCDPFTGRVVGLSVFQDANLTGTIPNAVAGLVHLPAISGPIPPGIAKLSNLSELIISWTAVSGPVPSFLGALTKLTLLDLSFNSLTGAIPASLAALPNLFSIEISRNRLTGSLPRLLFSKAPQEAYLRLSHNNLTGSVPARVLLGALHAD